MTKLIITKPDGKKVYATLIRIENTVAGPKVLAQSGKLLLRVSPKDVEFLEDTDAPTRSGS